MSPGTLAFVYASSPVKAIVGVFLVRDIITAPVDVLWNRIGRNAGISYKEFERYFFGASQGHAISIAGAKSMRSPISLEVLRSIWPGFHPPQSFYYVVPGDEDARRALSWISRCFEFKFGQGSGVFGKGGESPSLISDSLSTSVGPQIGRMSKHKKLYMHLGTPIREWLKEMSPII